MGLVYCYVTLSIMLFVHSDLGEPISVTITSRSPSKTGRDSMGRGHLVHVCLATSQIATTKFSAKVHKIIVATWLVGMCVDSGLSLCKETAARLAPQTKPSVRVFLWFHVFFKVVKTTTLFP